LGDFGPSEQSFVSDLIFDLKHVGSLAPKTVNKLANSKFAFDELRDVVQEIAATFVRPDYVVQKLLARFDVAPNRVAVRG